MYCSARTKTALRTLQLWLIDFVTCLVKVLGIHISSESKVRDVEVVSAVTPVFQFEYEDDHPS